MWRQWIWVKKKYFTIVYTKFNLRFFSNEVLRNCLTLPVTIFTYFLRLFYVLLVYLLIQARRLRLITVGMYIDLKPCSNVLGTHDVFEFFGENQIEMKCNDVYRAISLDGPVYSLITVEISFAIHFLSILRSLRLKSFYSGRRRLFSSSFLCIVFRLVLRFNKPDKCAMGFRSGACTGRS